MLTAYGERTARPTKGAHSARRSSAKSETTLLLPPTLAHIPYMCHRAGMGAVTVYLDEKTERMVRRRAKRAHKSVSAWVKELVTGGKTDANGWPVGYFERTYGSLADVDDFAAPAKGVDRSVQVLDL